jgi:hypothetical protein
VRRLLLAAALAAPSVAAAQTRLIPVAVPFPIGGSAAAAGTVATGIISLGLPVSGGLARSISPLSPAITGAVAASPARGPMTPASRRPALVAALQSVARLSVTVEGGRQAWDRALFVGRAAQEGVVAGAPTAVFENALKPAAQEAAAARRPSIEEGGRWQRMKASTKQDFRALFASIRKLKGSLVAPRSGAAFKADAQAFGRFLSEVRQLGWKVIGAVILYYLVRDSILYILIPYLVLHGVFR